MGRNTLFWLAKRWNPRTSPGAPVRTHQRTALSLAIPRTLLALADEVIK
jgi:hypothetical protein